MAERENTVRQGEAPAVLWWTMWAGPFAWACDLGLSYALVHHTCSTGHHYVLHTISVVCVLIALSGLVAGWAAYRTIPKEASDEGRRPMDRAHFQIIFGIVFSIAFTVVIIAGAVPRWILSPCQ
jgi:hypothetical protein